MNFFLIIAKENLEKSLLILFLSIISGCAGGSVIILALNGIQEIIVGRNYLFFAICLPLSAILFVSTKRISQNQSIIIVEDIQEKLILRVANSFRQTTLDFIEKQDLANIYSQIVNTQTITYSITKSINMFQNMMTIFTLWIYIFCLSPQMGLFVLIFFFLSICIYEFQQGLLKPVVKKEHHHEIEMYRMFDHILSGFKEIKLNAKKNDAIYKQLVDHINQNQNHRLIKLFSYVQFNQFVNSSFLFVMGIIAFILPSYYSHSVITQLLTITLYVWLPTEFILAVIPDVSSGEYSLEQLFSLTKDANISDETITELFNPANETVKTFNTLRFCNLTFRYELDKSIKGFSIGPFNLTIRSAEIVFIIGGNGSGKTTFLKLLTGLYQPTSGKILMDDKKANMDSYRHLFSSIFSDFILFEKLYGLDEVEDQQVMDLLVQMDLGHKTQWVENQFSSLKLSTGQRKRLALIIALLEDRPIYIFDEWAADQDAHFREYFYESLLPSLKNKGKTVISVTHDDSFFHVADKIIKLDYGEIIQKDEFIS